MTTFYKLADFSGYSYTFNDLTPSEIAQDAMKNPYVYMVTNRIASTAAYLKQKNNPKWLTAEKKRIIGLNLLLYGECFIYPIKPVGIDKTITSIEILDNQSVTIQYNESSIFKPIINYQYNTRTFLPSEIIHIKYQDPRKIYQKGFSPLSSLRAIYEASNSINDFEKYLYQNRGVIGFISGVGEMPLTSTEKKEIQSQYDAETLGVGNAGKIKLVQNEIKFTPVSFKPSEMGSLESSLEKLRIICASYNVDSSLFNDPANSTYNNVYEANKAFYNNAVLPLADYINDKISDYLIEIGFITERKRIAIDYKDIDALKKDETLDAQAKQTYASARKTFLEAIKMELELQLITLDEAKAKIGLYDNPEL